MQTLNLGKTGKYHLKNNEDGPVKKGILNKWQTPNFGLTKLFLGSRKDYNY